MRLLLAAPFAIAFALSASAPTDAPVAPPTLVANANTASAGTLASGVLSIELDATTGAWSAASGMARGASVAAFAERGKGPLLPGPLIRVPVGTVVRASIHNMLPRTITFFLPTSQSTEDSVVVEPGATRELQVRAAAPGNFSYRATSALKIAQRVRMDGALGGGFVVDTAGTPARPRDRVMVIMQTPDSGFRDDMEAGKTLGQSNGHFEFTINGKAWPNTKHIAATVGDSLHWRVINASFDIHPMHLHGFYFRVDAFNERGLNPDIRGVPGRMVVTERMSAFSGMSMTWVPERPGNWIFHCHFAVHLAPDGSDVRDPAGDGRLPMEEHSANHALTGMVGLALELNIAPRSGARAAVAPARARQLRLIAVMDSGFPPLRPSLRFVIEENGRQTTSPPGFSPTLYLRRDEPVAITVVNHLCERTSVHWHGMELDSYFDGVAGLSGAGTRLAPIIAPNDSFVARFTPPRSGTFMYHSHVDDIRQQPAGLLGAMIVGDGPTAKSVDDHEIFLKGARDGDIGNNPLEIGGVGKGDTLVIRAGRTARFRLMNLTAIHPTATVTLTTRPDSVFSMLTDPMIVRWTPVAKDGADLAAVNRTPRPARQVFAMGETYDFEFTPPQRGQLLRLEVRSGAGLLLARLPVRVE